MFTTLTQKLLLGIYIFVLLSIPIGSYLASQSQTVKSRASEQKTQKPIVPVTPKPLPSAGAKLLNLVNIASDSAESAKPSPEPSASSATITSYGPTLSFAVSLEGRAKDNQSAKVFVGIVEGNISANPKFLLSFTVDLSASGKYSGLSLAGLNPGTTYTALIKGPAQIASAKTFSMSPAISNLNEGQAIDLISGDLNDDNTINSTDYLIAQKAIGTSQRSKNWNSNADINKDNIVNAFDLGIISKNMGKTGASGAWTSPIPKIASPSASLSTPAVGSPGDQPGYWIWVPK